MESEIEREPLYIGDIEENSLRMELVNKSNNKRKIITSSYQRPSVFQ